MSQYRFLLLSLCFSAICQLAEGSEGVQSAEIEFTRYLYKQGDDQRWAQHGWQDSDWFSVYHQGLPQTPQIFWTRNHVLIDGAESAGPMVVHASLLGAYEVYWDGQLIGASGQVGIDSEQEIPGPIINRFAIPEALFSDGNHVISLRVSSFRAPENLRTRYYEVDIVSTAQLLSGQIVTAMLPLVFLGCFLITAIYYQAVYWIVRRDKPSLLFSFLCVSISALLLSQRWKVLIGYNYDWHWFNLILMLFITSCLALLLVTFILYQFNLKHKLSWITGVGLLIFLSAVLAENFENANTQTLIIAVAASIILTGFALKKNSEGAVPANIGLVIVVITILMDSNNYIERYLFPSFTALMLFMFVSLTLRMKEQQKSHESALLTSERLKTELLKKNIQPHFMLNSLASIGELIETDPKQADNFIQGLAEEFKLLNMMTEKKLVSLTDEIALCESHATVSSLRNNVAYRFNCELEDSEKLVPPAIFHTLLENGISHNMDLRGEITMSLQQTVGLTETVYQFSAPLGKSSNSSMLGSGTGTKYVQARLEENFANRWSLEERCVENRWLTIIKLQESASMQQANKLK